jgi:hypothetical protein
MNPYRNSSVNEQTGSPLINISGDKIALGPLCRELIPLYQRWNNDFAVNRTTAEARPVTLEEQRRRGRGAHDTHHAPRLTLDA